MIPAQNHKIYDKILVGGIKSPGLCELKSDVFRESIIQVSKSPGTTIGIPKNKGENSIELEYEFQLWENSHYTAWDEFFKMLDKAQRAQPEPIVLDLVDPRLRSVKVSSVIVTAISSEKKLGPTKTGYSVKFREVKPKKDKVGTGAPKGSEKAGTGATNPIQAQIDAANKEGDRVAADIAAREAARNAGGG